MSINRGLITEEKHYAYTEYASSGVFLLLFFQWLDG